MTGKELRDLLNLLDEKTLQLPVETWPIREGKEGINLCHSFEKGPAPIYYPHDWEPPPRVIAIKVRSPRE